MSNNNCIVIIFLTSSWISFYKNKFSACFIKAYNLVYSVIATGFCLWHASISTTRYNSYIFTRFNWHTNKRISICYWIWETCITGPRILYISRFSCFHSYNKSFKLIEFYNNIINISISIIGFIITFNIWITACFWYHTEYIAKSYCSSSCFHCHNWCKV